MHPATKECTLHAKELKRLTPKPVLLCDLYYRGQLVGCNMTYAIANAKIKQLSLTGSYKKRLFDKRKNMQKLA